LFSVLKDDFFFGVLQVDVPETMKSVISKLSELMGVKQLHADVITVSIELNISISTRMFHKLVMQIREMGFKLEKVNFNDDGYFEAVHRDYETGESITVKYVPVDGFIIRSIVYRKSGDVVK